MNKPTYFVDAHHHLWDLEHCHYPWLMEKNVPRFFGDPSPIQKNYLIADFQRDIGDIPVKKSVHIQVGVAEQDSLKETQWVQHISEHHDYPTAIVAFCDMRSDIIEQILDHHSQNAAFRGVRQIIGRSAKEDAQTGTASLLADANFIRNLDHLQKRNLSFDLQLTPPLMQMAAHKFAALEGLKIALCHAGSPSDFSKEGLQQWADGLKSLANNPNIICKLSGFAMFNHDWTMDDIRSLILTAIDIFGPQRIAFGSNFPVDKLYISYAKMMQAYLEITQAFSHDEINQMFHGTAENFYKI